MKRRSSVRLVALLTSVSLATALQADPIHVGDSGVAVREADGKSIDVDTTVKRLAAMHVDTYLYDIPHGTDAWDKLPAFADAAAVQHIDVWVYLFPWSLAKRGGRNEANEPFGTDYVKWCGEVGKLMAAHANVKGIVMDDFASNISEPDRFSVPYVRQMLDAGHAGNASFAFQPILYFDGPWEQTLGTYASMFHDGAIVCYPRSQREVDHALTYLNDQPRGASMSVELPRKRHLKPGEETVAVGRIDEDSASRAHGLSFFIDEHGGNDGKGGVHHVVIRVDGHDVWHRALDGSTFNRDVSVTLPHVTARSTITIALVCDRTADDETVKTSFDDVRLVDGDGLTLGRQPRWADELDDGISFTISQAVIRGEQRWQIPMTIMVAGAPYEHNKVFNEPGDAGHIGPKVKEAIGWAKAGKARGVLTWWTPKDNAKNAVRDAVTQAFLTAKE